MFEIDKEAFGRFVAERRKEKGYTQKALAEKLYVSDKAVSKWERALSMPDVSLLIPLADILEVSVTELLEGRKLNQISEMDAVQVETLVKKALSFSEETPEKRKAHCRKRAMVFGSCTILVALELLVLLWYAHQPDCGTIFSGLLLMAGMSFGFGIYCWFFMKERLPVYYDENKINAYSDGVFRMNIPGVSFNNSNWPYIVRTLRYWSATTMVTIPAICLLLSMAAAKWKWNADIQYAALALYLAGLFLPIYVFGRKYQ